MTNYYIRKETYGTTLAHIVSEKIIKQAKLGMNYLDADNYVFYCKSDNIQDAEEKYCEEFSYIFYC